MGSAVTVGQVCQSVRANAVRVVGVAPDAPAAKVVQGQSVAGVQGDDSADFPIPQDRVQGGRHIVPKLLAAAEWKLIGHVAGHDVSLVVVARTPILTRVIDVLPSRLSAGTGRLCAAPTGSKVSRRVAHALRPGVG